MADDFDEFLMDRDQAQHAERVLGLWESHAPLVREQHKLRGGMIWKRARGHEYLFRYFQDTDTGAKKFVSQGRRSPETEAAHAAYFVRRERVQTHLDHTGGEVERAGRMAQALRMARFPATPARIVQGLWLEGFFDERLMLMGATAMLGYELKAGFLAPPSLFRGESLRIMVRDKIDDRLAEVVERLAKAADAGFAVVERSEDHLVLDGGRGGRIEAHTMTSLIDYLMDRGLDTNLFYDVLTGVMENPAWNGVAVARDAQVMSVTTIDPRAHAVLTHATALTEPDTDRAELLTRRAKLIRWVAEQRLGLAFTQRQISAFPDLWDEADREAGLRWGTR